MVYFNLKIDENIKFVRLIIFFLLCLQIEKTLQFKIINSSIVNESLVNSNNEKLTIKNEDFFFNFNIGVNKSDFFAKYETDLEEIFEIWNPKSIIKIWYLKNFNITYNCELDVSRFLIGILKEENWALRSKSIYCCVEFENKFF